MNKLSIILSVSDRLSRLFSRVKRFAVTCFLSSGVSAREENRQSLTAQGMKNGKVDFDKSLRPY